MSPTPCIHNDKKSIITIISGGIKSKLLSCNECINELESFQTIQVVPN